MIGAVVTLSTDGEWAEMVWNDYKKYFFETDLRLSTVRSINIMRDKDNNEIGIQLVFDSHNSEVFQPEWFANVNGVTDLNTNTKLRNAFRTMLQPV